MCNPLDAKNIVDEKAGLRGNFYYLDSTQTPYSNSLDYIKNGHRGTADVYLSQIDLPTRDYMMGFDNGDGSKLSVDGHDLTENFGLGLESHIKLGSMDQTGKYQLALIADDGATLFLGQKDHDYQGFVVAEGAHQSQMVCATKTISMKTSTRIPMFLSYFQGPRYKIALIMMWRKLPDKPTAADLADDECGRVGEHEFVDESGNMTSAYNGLLARGWKVMNPENFELQEGSNKCMGAGSGSGPHGGNGNGGKDHGHKHGHAPTPTCDTN